MLNRALLIIGSAMTAVGLGVDITISTLAPHQPLGMPATVATVGIALVTIAVVRGLLIGVQDVLVEVKDAQAELRTLTEAVNRPADEAWDAGRQIGYDQGWVECEATHSKRWGMRSVGHLPRPAADTLPPTAAWTGSEGHGGRVASPQDRPGG